MISMIIRMMPRNGSMVMVMDMEIIQKEMFRIYSLQIVHSGLIKKVMDADQWLA